jgi:cysteine desulfurase
MRQIFMDHSSTTKVDKDVVAAMLPYFSEYFGNPSSVHSIGREANQAVERARHNVASLLGASPEEIIFTAGGTEADNIAIKGAAYANMDRKGLKGPHIISSKIEHPAVLRTCEQLEKEGFEVAYLPVDAQGVVKMDELERLISEGTFLISVMFANNEIGTIEPMNEIGELARKKGILFHTDAVQAVGKTPIDVRELKIDLLALSSHKMYGPKGIGALYVRKGVKLQPIVHGGGHEQGLRSSTLNVPGIVGLGTAAKLAEERLVEDMAYQKRIRDQLIASVLKMEGTTLNGHPEQRLVNNAHFRFTGVGGTSILEAMDARGIATSTSSACSSKKTVPSHVLDAIGLTVEEASCAIRLSIGRETTEEEINITSEALLEVVTTIRNERSG